MPGNNSTIKIGLQIDEKGAVKILKNIGDESKKTGKKGKDSFQEMDKGARKASGGMESVTKSLLKIGVGVTGIIAVKEAMGLLIAKTGQSITAASDLQETTSKYETVFAGQTEIVNMWSQNLVDKFAMSRRESRGFLSSIQDLLIPMGMQSDSAANLSNEIVKLSADLGSFNNLPTQKVIEDVQSALVGEYDTMKKYGVVLNATRVQQEALNMGFADNVKKLTAAHKAQAAYKLIVESSTAAIGDMDRTSDSYANVSKKLDTRFENLSSTIGQKFLPAATKVKTKTADLIEDIDKMLLKDQFLVELINLTTEEFSAWGEQIIANKDDLILLAKDGALSVVGGFRLMAKGAQVFEDSIAGIRIGFASMLKLTSKAQIEYYESMIHNLVHYSTKIENGVVTVNIKRQQEVAESLKNYKEKLSDAKITLDAANHMIDDNSQKILDNKEEYKKLYAEIDKFGEKIEETYKTHKDANTGAEKSTSDTLSKLDKLHDKYTSGVMSNQNTITDTVARSNLEIARLHQINADDMTKADEAYYKIKKRQADDNYAAIARLHEINTQDMIKADAAYLAWHKKYTREKILASDDFFSGVKLGLEQNTEYTQTWAQHGMEISQYAASEMQRAFSDSLFNVMKGDIDKIGDVWNNTLDSMLHKLADTITEMMLNWAITKTLDVGSSMLSGFLSSYEEGVWDLDINSIGKMYPDSAGQPGIPAVVHQGEMIIPQKTAAGLRDMFSEMGIENLEALGAFGSGGLGSFGQSFLNRMGIKTITTSASALSLANQGYDVGVGDVLKSITSPESLASALMGGMSTAINEELGMRSSNWGKGGQFVLSLLGGVLAGPVGGMLGGILGGIIGMGIGDLFDARGNEVSRDKIEDAMGWFAGIRAQGNAKNLQYNDYVGETDYGEVLDNLARGLESGRFGYGYSGPDYAGDFSGGGYADGGIISKLMVPQGEDGWAPVQLSEGVVSRKGMETLDQINSGQFRMDLSALAAEMAGLRRDFFPMLKEVLLELKNISRIKDYEYKKAKQTA